MSRLQTSFPEGSRFGLDEEGELMMWQLTPGPLDPGPLDPVRVSDWVDAHTVEGTAYDVVSSVGGEVVTVVLTPPASGISSGLSVGRRYLLVRYEDVSEVSGTGVVAHGIQWPDGTCSQRWAVPGLPPSFANWDSIEAVQQIHGHHGKTKIEWVD